MKVTINGEPKDLPQGITVRGVIQHLGLDKGACAAEVNKRLVPKREHEGRVLTEGDVVEVVSLVGGG